jgi:hypothetical protein
VSEPVEIVIDGPAFTVSVDNGTVICEPRFRRSAIRTTGGTASFGTDNVKITVEVIALSVSCAVLDISAACTTTGR